jgi:hypothetical protein
MNVTDFFVIARGHFVKKDFLVMLRQIQTPK